MVRPGARVPVPSRRRRKVDVVGCLTRLGCVLGCRRSVASCCARQDALSRLLEAGTAMADALRQPTVSSEKAHEAGFGWELALTVTEGGDASASGVVGLGSRLGKMLADIVHAGVIVSVEGRRALADQWD